MEKTDNPKETAQSFKIIVKRTNDTVSEGTLSYYKNGNSKPEFTTPCWEDPANLIASTTYEGCTAEIMTSSRRKAIFIPNTSPQTEIFIHEGTDPSWSDGCIVCDKKRVLEIYNDTNRWDSNGNKFEIEVVVS